MNRIENLINHYYSISNKRNYQLFSSFLVRGYKRTTLSTVGNDLKESNLYAKLLLGMVITLIDDFADNPKHRDKVLLKKMYAYLEYGIKNTNNLDPNQLKNFQLLKYLKKEFDLTVRSFPCYQYFKDLLIFDLLQVYSANKFAELLTDKPQTTNLLEMHRYGQFNMGIVAAGTIDLMCIEKFNPEELGTAREVFHHAQRIARISNMITTFEREKKEQDITSELHSTSQKTLILEQQALLKKEYHISSFNYLSFLNSFQYLDTLHHQLQAVI